MSVQEFIYTPDRVSSWRPRVWREMLNELLLSRELTWRLFLRDFSSRYRQSVLGMLWALILPLIAVATFVFLNSAGLLNVGVTDVPYPLYALLGLTIWQVFASGLTFSSNSIVAGGNIVIKINFPKETLVLGALGAVIVELGVRVALLAIAMAVFQVAPKWTAVFFPLTLLPLLMFTVGLGFFLSLLNVLARDVANVVTLATTFLMLLTPVVYPTPRGGLFGTLMTLNPLAGLVTAPRDMVVTGYLTDPVAFAWASAAAVVFLLFAWRVFHLSESRLAERL